MKITLNNKTVELAHGATADLATLLSSQGLPEKGIAVALNGTLVRRDAWSTTILNDGDKLTVIRAVCGG